VSDNERQRRHRRRIAALATLLVGLSGLLLILIARRSRSRTEPSGDPAAAVTAGGVATQRRPAPPAPAEDPDKPIIDEVLVEKKVVCQGEENLITVRAHTPQGKNDPFLRYVVGEGSGRSVPIRSYLPPAGAPPSPPRMVSVFGRNGVAAHVVVPDFQVKMCPARHALSIVHRQLPNTSADFELLASVKSTAGQPAFVATRYRWTFGDGTGEETDGPVASHHFVTTGQALTTDFLISCEARDRDGQSVQGRLSLPVADHEFEDLAYKGVLVLSKQLTPRFPEIDQHGMVTQRVRLFHHRPTAVRLERVLISYRAKDGSAPLPPEEKPAAAVFGTATLPPDPGIEATLTLNTAGHPTVVMADYLVTGQTPDGRPVHGEFSVMKPPEMPTPQQSPRVMDPFLVEKIKRTRIALNKTYVNDEDIRTLANRGAFADLAAAEEKASHRSVDHPGKLLPATTRAEQARARGASASPAATATP
jgi:hypothetical protein